MILDIFLTLFLVLLNGFFVAAEFAIVKIRISTLEVKAATGNNVAKLAKNIIENLDAYLSATQLGITLASLGLGWIGESVVSDIIIKSFAAAGQELDPEMAHRIALPVAFALITVLHIVFGELAPKSIAIRHAEATTLAVAAPLKFFYLVFRPFIWMLNGFANIILKAIGIKPIHGDDSHTEEEIRFILTESKDSGAIKKMEHELIENVFRFDERTVRQIMIPRTRVSAVSVDDSLDEILKLAMEDGFSRMPVYRDSLDHIVGLLYAKDLLKMEREKNNTDINSIIRKVLFIPETKRISDLLREFQKNRVHMAVVIDEFGGTSGIVTMEDVIEELVGEIQDEYDEEKPVVVVKKESEYLVDAQKFLSDINKYLPVALPETENYDTLAGMLISVFGHIPEINDEIKFQGYTFRIMKRSGHMIESVLITIPPEKEYEEDKSE